MAILKIKRLIEDLENNTTQVLQSAVASVTYASSAGQSGTAYKATSAGYTGTAVKATSAGYAGTARVAHFASSGTGGLSGTSLLYTEAGTGKA